MSRFKSIDLKQNHVVICLLLNLSPTYKIHVNYINMQHNYVHMQHRHVFQHMRE